VCWFGEKENEKRKEERRRNISRKGVAWVVVVLLQAGLLLSTKRMGNLGGVKAIELHTIY
jgi:hypothetical protein